MTITARPTTYKGIQMRSRLEARYAAGFDKLGLHWEYEPQAFASEDGQYLPDFRLNRVDGTGCDYIEVKPESLTMLELADHLQRMEIVLASEPSAGLMLFIDGAWLVFLRNSKRWTVEVLPDYFIDAVAYRPETVRESDFLPGGRYGPRPA